jgi:hypothetical protein
MQATKNLEFIKETEKENDVKLKEALLESSERTHKGISKLKKMS